MERGFASGGVRTHAVLRPPDRQVSFVGGAMLRRDRRSLDCSPFGSQSLRDWFLSLTPYTNSDTDAR